MQFAKPKTRPQFEEWSQRFRICCGFWSNNICQVQILPGRIRGRHIRRNASAEVPARDMEKRQAAGTKVCGPVPAAAKSVDLKVVRCRCTGACPNAASRTRCSGK